MEYIDRVVRLKTQVMTADQVTAIELGFEYRNQSLEQFLIMFFERSAGKKLQKHMLLAEFVISLEKYNKLELILMFQQLLHNYDSELMHAVILAKSHIENYLSTRKDIVEKLLETPKPSSLFPQCYATQVTEVYFSAIFHQAQTSLIRGMRHKGFFGMGADVFSATLGNRTSVTLVDLLPILSRTLCRVIKKYFNASQILSERGLQHQAGYQSELLEEIDEFAADSNSFFSRPGAHDLDRGFYSQPVDSDTGSQQLQFVVDGKVVSPKTPARQYRTNEKSPVISKFYEQSSELVQDQQTGEYKMVPVFKSTKQSRTQTVLPIELTSQGCKSYCLYEKILDEVQAVLYQAERTFTQLHTQLKKAQEESVKNLATRVLGVVVQMPQGKSTSSK